MSEILSRFAPPAINPQESNCYRVVSDQCYISKLYIQAVFAKLEQFLTLFPKDIGHLAGLLQWMVQFEDWLRLSFLGQIFEHPPGAVLACIDRRGQALNDFGRLWDDVFEVYRVCLSRVHFTDFRVFSVFMNPKDFSINRYFTVSDNTGPTFSAGETKLIISIINNTVNEKTPAAIES